MEKKELKKIIEKHESWLDGEGGEKANLREADLREADLRGAELDFSCWPLWCGSLQTKADSKIVIQLLYHTMRLAENSETDEELKNALFTKELIAQANRFHRVEECGKIKEEE